ncbi:kinase-like domain-containing protein [Rhizophagus irregularis DAOM 181602=DAOM 197198]|nr:kinase-like domain-containing protein [Rhizophagus irregularis DAOM 181602=DAOM 197198]
MEQSIDHKLKGESKKKKIALKQKYKKCNECNHKRKNFDEVHKICHLCYEARTILIRNIELIAEEGFNKIYKAIWIDGPISKWNKKQQKYNRLAEMVVALKVINNSGIITNKELNELKIFYRFAISSLNRTCVNEYYGITYDPITQNYMIITKYCNGGNLTHYIANNFFNMDWNNKLSKLHNIIDGLHSLHMVNILHKNYHSGNIFLSNKAVIGDLSKCATANDDDDDEVYGIIPYIAPEIFQALINKLCDGFRPPILINAPKGYIELMQECLHFDPCKRPPTFDIQSKIAIIRDYENNSITKIIPLSDNGPVITNPGAIYKSRPLSALIKSAESIRIKNNSGFDKRKFDNELIEDNDNNQDKKIKFIYEHENYSKN